MILSQQYLSEGYEYDLTSRFISLNEVEVTKEERFNTSNVSHYIGGNRDNGRIYTVSSFNDHHWCWFCGTLNDSISSMKATNIWQGC